MNSFRAIRWWVTEPSPPILVLYGPQGSGKSVLAKAIALLLPNCRTLQFGNFKLEANHWLLSEYRILEINNLEVLRALSGQIFLFIEMELIKQEAWLPLDAAIEHVRSLIQ